MFKIIGNRIEKYYNIVLYVYILNKMFYFIYKENRNNVLDS